MELHRCYDENACTVHCTTFLTEPNHFQLRITNWIQCFKNSIKWQAEIHTRRQATQHCCLPSLLGGGDKGFERVEKIFYTGPTRAAKTEQKSLVPARPHDKPNQPTKEGPRDLFHLYSLSPHSPQFQQSPLSSLSGDKSMLAFHRANLGGLLWLVITRGAEPK
jgi:hypothetical protein